MIRRIIYESIQEHLFQGKAIIITGSRQVGKTTLLRALQKQSGKETIWLNCDEPDIRLLLENSTSTALKNLIGNNEIVFIDEAQRVPNIGITLKLLIDTFPEIQVVATGSSALELANEINEPLTGRKWEYHLYPLSTEELIGYSSLLEEKRLLENRLIFGFYPDVVNHPDKSREILAGIADNYLYKDLLSLENIRKPALLEKILTAVALQIGGEVSLSELGQLVGADHRTVEEYLRLLEQCFIIFQLGAFSRNLRNEIKKNRKIYFYDNGIRNTIIKNFNPVGLRQDIGALWENFLMSERKKTNTYHNKYGNSYFWRTHGQQEIDLIEEYDDVLHAHEFKWNEKRKTRIPSSFAEAYPDHKFSAVNRENYINFLTE